jgi:hypothetical protein
MASFPLFCTIQENGMVMKLNLHIIFCFFLPVTIKSFGMESVDGRG